MTVALKSISGVPSIGVLSVLAAYTGSKLVAFGTFGTNIHSSSPFSHLSSAPVVYISAVHRICIDVARASRANAELSERRTALLRLARYTSPTNHH